MERVSRFLTKFAKESIATLGASNVFFSQGKDLSLLGLTNRDTIEAISCNLLESLKQFEEKATYLLPLSQVTVSDQIISDRLFWIPGQSDLNIALARFGRFQRRLLSDRFPPYERNSACWPVSPTDSWMACYESNHSSADSVMQAFLGALSMAMDFPESHAFTYAPTRFPKGHLEIRQDGSCTMYFDRPPYLPEGLGAINVSQSMIEMIRGLIVNRATDQRVQVALEYVAAGWKPIGRIGFLHNAIALDALFGEQNAVRESILAGLEKFASRIEKIRERGKLLYKLRNQLLHGESKSLESCPEYLEYYETFEVDPAYDQTRILRTCFWEKSGAKMN